MTTPTVRPRRWRQRLAIALSLIALLLIAYAIVTSLLVNQAAAATPRDSETGIAVGAEPRDLGPEDAPGAVLFIHGFVGGSNNFADLPDQVADAGWRVRCLRLPGHGTTPKDFAKTSADELVEAVRQEVKALRETLSLIHI